MGSFQGDFPSLVFLSIQYLRGMSGAGKRCQPNREVDAPVMSPRGKRRRHNPALVWEHSPTTHSSGSESRERPPLGSSARTATRLALLARLAAAPVVVSLRHTAAAERKERVKKKKKAQSPRRQHNLSERHPPGGPASRPQPMRARCCCATNSPVVAKSSARDASGAARAAARDPAPCGDDPAHPSVHCDPPRVHLLFERRARAHSRTWFWQALRCATRSSFGPMKKICIFGERRGVTRTQEGTLAAQDGLGTTAEEVSGWGPTASTRRRLRRRDLSEDRNARSATTRRTAPSVRERATTKSAPWGGGR